MPIMEKVLIVNGNEFRFLERAMRNELLYFRTYDILETKPKKLDRPYQPDYEKHRPSVSNKKPFGLK